MENIASFFQKFSFNQIGTTFAVLFAVIDILGSIPIIVGIRSKVGHIQSEKASIAAGSPVRAAAANSSGARPPP